MDRNSINVDKSNISIERSSFAASEKAPIMHSNQVSKEEEGTINKKRQWLSDQLRQISQKIDKEII